MEQTYRVILFFERLRAKSNGHPAVKPWLWDAAATLAIEQTTAALRAGQAQKGRE